MPNETQINQAVQKIKSGIKTTEFFLSSVVVAAGGVVQFLPSNTADATVKAVAIISAVLAAVGYTTGRSIIKASSASSATVSTVIRPLSPKLPASVDAPGSGQLAK